MIVECIRFLGDRRDWEWPARGPTTLESKSRTGAAGFRMAETDGCQAIGRSTGISKESSPMLGQVQRRADRESCSVLGGREPGDDFAVIDRERHGSRMSHERGRWSRVVPAGSV